jgi:hypothetical protein
MRWNRCKFEVNRLKNKKLIIAILKYRKTLITTIPWGKNRVTKNLPSQKSLNSILNFLRWQFFFDSILPHEIVNKVLR